MTPKTSLTSQHEFILILTGLTELTPPIMDALFQAGCDDATATLRLGRVFLTFARKSPSLREAILSAIRNVKQAGIGAGVLCVNDSNLVSQAGIARRINRTRQLVGQYVSAKRGPGNFPAPSCDLSEGHPLWQWCEVSSWLWQNGIVGDHVLNESRVVAAINSVLEYLHQRGRDASLVDEVFQIIEAPSPTFSP